MREPVRDRGRLSHMIGAIDGIILTVDWDEWEKQSFTM